MTRIPLPTTNIKLAKTDMDEFGYCLLEVLQADEIGAIRSRLLEQKAAEEQLGVHYHLPDKKQLIKFLLNKGEVFRALLFKPTVRKLIGHVLGPSYLLSSFHGHIAHPGATERFHTDQFWMPPPTDSRGRAQIRPGEITREMHRGRRAFPESSSQSSVISPPFVCNAMWMLDDFTEENGATIFVPGSHLSGRQPDPEFDTEEHWVPATAPAGTVAVFEGRVWHSTGANRSNKRRIGLTTNFCAPQCRQQENFFLGTSDEVLEQASDELLELIGFKAWQGYGAYETNNEFLSRDRRALGELNLSGER